MKRFGIVTFAAIALVTLATTTAAHGPQIQITNDNGQLTTRLLHKEAPYSHTLTDPKSVYVMPLLADGGVYYSRPNAEIDPLLGTPLYFFTI